MKPFPRGMQVSRAEIAARVLAEQEQKAAEERKKKKAIKSSGGDDYVGEITANLNKDDSFTASSVDGAISMLSAAAVGESSPSSKCAPGHRIQQMIQRRGENWDASARRPHPQEAGEHARCVRCVRRAGTAEAQRGEMRPRSPRDAPEIRRRASATMDVANLLGEFLGDFFAGEPEPQGVAVHGAAVKAVGQVAG